MKLPRYLQVALLATVVAAGWSYFSEEEASLAVTSRAQHTASPIKPAESPTASPPAERIDLFSSPQAGASAAQQRTAETAAPPPAPTLPDLPLHILGAWWSNHQRILVLTDGVDTWPVCRQCQAAGKIWIGSEPVSGWRLKAVGKDHLLFEWQLTHEQRRLELGELQTEPAQ